MDRFCLPMLLAQQMLECRENDRPTRLARQTTLSLIGCAQKINSKQRKSTKEQYVPRARKRFSITAARPGRNRLRHQHLFWRQLGAKGSRTQISSKRNCVCLGPRHECG